MKTTEEGSQLIDFAAMAAAFCQTEYGCQDGAARIEKVLQHAYEATRKEEAP